MKQAKQRARQHKIKPRVGVVAVLKKGGVHQRRDKRAERARHKADFIKTAADS